MSNSDQEKEFKKYRDLLNNCDFYEDEIENDNNDSKSFLEKLETYATSGKIVECVAGNVRVRINIGATCLLKEIGDKVLGNKLVKDRYEEIKPEMLSHYSKQSFKEWHKKVGRGLSSWKKSREAKEHYDFFKKDIDDEYGNYDEYKNLQTDDERGEYDLKKILGKYYTKGNREKIDERVRKSIGDSVNESHDDDHNKKLMSYIREMPDNDIREDIQEVIDKRDEKRRRKTEYIRADDIGPGFHLARIKASMVLDKSVVIPILYHIKVNGFSELWKDIKFKTQENEKLTIYESGKISHVVECSITDHYRYLSYNDIGRDKWPEWFDKNNEYSVKDIKTILKIFLRGDDGMNDWFRSDDNKIWRLVIELMFGVEIKRTSSAILTNAMFFDLLNKGRYNLDDLFKKLPVEFRGFVKGSSYVDVKMNKVMFDFRDKDEAASQTDPEVGDGVKKLAERDRDILKDWLELKGVISHITETTEIIKIKPKYFYDLIDEWYAIKIEDLNKDKELKWHFSVTNVYNGVCKKS